jgi:hypothetical protein
VIFGMPQQVIRSGAADLVLPLDEIARAIQRGVGSAIQEATGAAGTLQEGARMSEQDKLSTRAEDFLALFNKGAEFTRELLKENERLRSRLAAVTDRQESARATRETGRSCAAS